ncbi:helix-turn-helix domain-containing protein [Mycobacterium gordonae]|uniref:Helix-turn-helix domain-containing protein n=1 Tax=Mycobacterium gordonae TaxID=1778 RepID=A0A1X1W223_MYCGO|nr:helix-turn-helix domain-containing protein [Mycobacterium gordonae]MCV7007428.1 helix-turn-helix domain-containing protein [Mycobacterium gordonae]ODR18963.1 hypothetical protein BHQ23_21230 [Mycobacterium gordonae]ORV80218.1 hypothetical protein AWC08_30390 [Mycobacterium gordonae]
MPNSKFCSSPEREHRFARINAAAAYLDVHPATIRKLIDDGKIHGYRNGQRLLRVDLNELDALMAGEA